MKFTELSTEQDILALIEYHNQHSDWVALDTETTGLDRFKDKLTDIIITGYTEEETALFSPTFLPLLTKLAKPIVAQNFRFDFIMCLGAGVDLRLVGLQHDVMLLDHLLDDWYKLEPERCFMDKPCEGWHSLDSIVKRRYNDNYKEVFWSKYETVQDAPREEQVEYASKDVYYTGKAYRDILGDLRRSGIPDSLIEHVRLFALALYDTEVEGVRLDLPYLETVGNELSTKISSLKREMRESVDLECTIIENEKYLEDLEEKKTDKGKANVKRPEFNFNSSTQLSTLLYDKLALPVQLNKKRNRTCDDAALEKLEHKHNLIPKLREYRGHTKIFGAFIEGSLEKCRNGRVYPSLNVNGTVTGRISSSNPNLQQLPSEGNIRGIYIPEPGYHFITADYESLEVVLAAHFSRDENLLKVVNEGASLHDITAAGLGIPRALAKTINFGLQYGAGAHKVAAVLGVSLEEGEKALNKYWETYKGLKAFMDSCHAKIDRGEPLVTPFGRQRHFPLKFDNFWHKQRAYRQGANSIIQGTGADCTNRSFYLVNNAFKKLGIGKAVLQVHDELVTMVKIGHESEATEILSTIMPLVGREINLTVPLKAKVSNPTIRWEK